HRTRVPIVESQARSDCSLLIYKEIAASIPRLGVRLGRDETARDRLNGTQRLDNVTSGACAFA
ncbi:MAG: hypothetical protein ACREP0_08415, partial [Rhodanobacteraceae bacterium]